jgi:N-acetylgalactosamine-N,N'-diacetylbacillosaminyl-diphospho-undecaprenol 4-alpha-N-acetylgalactosaminyltransferase
MERKRVVLFTSSLRAGGAERVVAALSQKLGDRYDVRILLFTNEIEYEIDTRTPLDILRTGMASEGFAGILRIPALAKQLVSYGRSTKPDIVISFLSRPNFVACLAKRIGLEAKVLISERAYTPLWYRDDEFRGRFGKWLTQRLYPYADAILPNSQGTADALEELYGIKNRYFVVKNPIALERINAQALEPVTDVKFDAFTFVCVARFLEQKNHQLLVDAFSLMGGTPRLLLIGKGPLRRSVMDQVKNLGLNERVTFVESTQNPFKYVARAQCFVLSSNFEGFPNVLLEALACGTPVISTDCLTGPRELLAPSGTNSAQQGMEIGEFGLLVPPDDPKGLAAAMELIQNDAALRTRLSTEGPRRAADFDEDAVVTEFCQIIEQVAPEPGKIENS